MNNGKMSDFGARILFANAKARIEQALALIDQYHEIRESIEALGYGQGPEDNILPDLHLSTNCYDLEDGEFLDEVFLMGPCRKRPDSGRAKPGKRVPMSSERLRLGRECGWTCFYCRCAGDDEKGPDGRAWHVDHKYPVSRGGDDLPDNHVLACATCNLGKHTESAIEYFEWLRLGHQIEAK